MPELLTAGPAPLQASGAPPERLRVAAVIPSFRRGSGGHATIVRVLESLRGRGHSVSVWLEDHEGRHARESPDVTERSFAEFFDAKDVPLHTSLSAWQGADLVLATGWQTVARTMLLPGCGARAYLVQDHEPDFYAVSIEAEWARDTYRQGLRCIAASTWLADLLRARYGARASHFDLALDHRIYTPVESDEREQMVVFYARAATPRRAVPLGLLALAELAQRRPEVQIALFGEGAPLNPPFPHRDLGVLDAAGLSSLYRRASVGMVLSMTNPSLIGLEMMASGLPCVELASESMRSTFGVDGPLTLAAPEPQALCEALERMLSDAAARKRAGEQGLALTAQRSWERAAQQVEEGLRAAWNDVAGASGAQPLP
jgi:glycosyltransferase involved in cell wall biosynthesis